VFVLRRSACRTGVACPPIQPLFQPWKIVLNSTYSNPRMHFKCKGILWTRGHSRNSLLQWTNYRLLRLTYIGIASTPVGHFSRSTDWTMFSYLPQDWIGQCKMKISSGPQVSLNYKQLWHKSALFLAAHSRPKKIHRINLLLRPSRTLCYVTCDTSPLPRKYLNLLARNRFVLPDLHEILEITYPYWRPWLTILCKFRPALKMSAVIARANQLVR
jgi:hypothetical protein